MPLDFIGQKNILIIIVMLRIATLLLLLTSILAQTPCNGTHPYSLIGTCYIRIFSIHLECPWIAPTQYYSYDPNYDCRATCPGGYYAFNGNLSCLAICPTTPNMTYYDHTNKKCVTHCPVNTFASTNRSCLACTVLSI